MLRARTSLRSLRMPATQSDTFLIIAAKLRDAEASLASIASQLRSCEDLDSSEDLTSELDTISECQMSLLGCISSLRSKAEPQSNADATPGTPPAPPRSGSSPRPFGTPLSSILADILNPTKAQ